MRRLLAIAAVVGLLVSCGRKTQPLPPIIEVPETTTDLTVHQEGSEIVLTWSYPALTRTGHQLTDLERIEVWRLELPPGQEEVASGPQGEELRRQLMLARGQLIARIEGAGLEKATRGSKLRWTDPVSVLTLGTTPSTFSYAVRSRRRDGTPSAGSNIVSWQPKAIPRQATGVRAELQADRIVLSWDPEEGMTYVVERRPEGADEWEVIAPFDLAEPTFGDTGARQEAGWRYRIRYLTAATAGPPSEEVRVFYRDVYPPPPASALVCLPEEHQVRLQWDASAEAGVTYKVFRRRGVGEWAHLEEKTPATELVDADPPVGDLEYAVKATDGHGNQSDAVTCLTRIDR